MFSYNKTYVYHLSRILFYCWSDVLQECGDFTLRVSDCEELVGVTHEKMMGLPLPRVLVFEVVIA